MTETQSNNLQAKQRSKKAATIAREQIQEIAVLSNDAVFSGAWSWPVQVCTRVTNLDVSDRPPWCRTAAPFLSPCTPESNQATHNQVDHPHACSHCGSVRRRVYPDRRRPGLLESASGLCSCRSSHLGCWFCHRNFHILYGVAIDRTSRSVRSGPSGTTPARCVARLPNDAPLRRSSYKKASGRS